MWISYFITVEINFDPYISFLRIFSNTVLTAARLVGSCLFTWPIPCAVLVGSSSQSYESPYDVFT